MWMREREREREIVFPSFVRLFVCFDDTLLIKFDGQ